TRRVSNGPVWRCTFLSIGHATQQQQEVVMPTPTETPLIELETEVWRARAQAKQKWLERSLAAPAKTPGETAQRMAWIKQALGLVKRKQAEIKLQTALIDAYGAHLSAIEMTLLGAAEQKTPATSAAAKRKD